MHSFSTLSSTVDDILQLISKFLSRLLENGVLKTYTFLHSENYSYVEKNYGNIVETIDDFKGLLLKICSSLPVLRKDIIEQETFNLLNSNSLTDCISRNDVAAFANHSNYNLYSADEIDDPLEQNIQFISSDTGNMCTNVSQNIAARCTDNLESRLDFISQELSNNPLKQDSSNIDFTECGSFSSIILKGDEHVQHSMSFSMNSNRNDVILSQKTETISYTKNSAKIDSLDSNFEAIDTMKYTNCNDSLYNTLKEAISGDFFQNMKFSSPDNSQSSKNDPYNEHVPYSQCEPSLQQIDLDILSNSNERINNALDGIFDDQFPVNDNLLGSDCWNVDINLPSAETMQNLPQNIDLRDSNYEISTCAENLKSKCVRSSLSNNLIGDFGSGGSTNLRTSIANDMNGSLRTMDDAIPSSLSSSISDDLTLHEKKYERPEILILLLDLEVREKREVNGRQF